MKTSEQDVQKLKKLFTALKKGSEKPKKPSTCDFIETIVFAVLCEKATESSAKAAVKKIQSQIFCPEAASISEVATKSRPFSSANMYWNEGL